MGDELEFENLNECVLGFCELAQLFCELVFWGLRNYFANLCFGFCELALLFCELVFWGLRNYFANLRNYFANLNEKLERKLEMNY